MFNFIVLLIVIFGAINWFAIGVFQFDLVAGIFGYQSAFPSRFVYTIIGIAGFWSLFATLFKKGTVVYYTKKTKQKTKRNTLLTDIQTDNDNNSQPHTQSFDVNDVATDVSQEKQSVLVAERTTEQEKIYDIPPAKPSKASPPKIGKAHHHDDQQ